MLWCNIKAEAASAATVMDHDVLLVELHHELLGGGDCVLRKPVSQYVAEWMRVGYRRSRRPSTSPLQTGGDKESGLVVRNGTPLLLSPAFLAVRGS